MRALEFKTAQLDDASFRLVEVVRATSSTAKAQMY